MSKFILSNGKFVLSNDKFAIKDGAGPVPPTPISDLTNTYWKFNNNIKFGSYMPTTKPEPAVGSSANSRTTLSNIAGKYDGYTFNQMIFEWKVDRTISEYDCQEILSLNIPSPAAVYEVAASSDKSATNLDLDGNKNVPVNDASLVINFTGGTLCTDATFIAWVQANAVQQEAPTGDLLDWLN